MTPSVPGSKCPNCLVGALFTLRSAPPATSASSLLHSLLSLSFYLPYPPPASHSSLLFLHLSHTQPFFFHSTPSIISPASQPPSLLSSLTVNNFALVMFFLVILFFFLFAQKIFSRHCITCYGERGVCVQGGGGRCVG